MKSLLFLWFMRVFVVVCVICIPATGILHAQEVCYGDDVRIYVKEDERARYLSVSEGGEIVLADDPDEAIMFEVHGGDDGEHIQPNNNVELSPVGVTIAAAPGNVLRGPISMLLSGGLYYDEIFMFQELVTLAGKDVFYMEKVEE